MLSIDYRASTSNGDEDRGDEEIRDIHALTPPPPPPPPPPQVRAWETSSHRSSTLSTTSEGGPSENFTSMSREFSALLNIAGSGMRNNVDDNDGGAAGNSLTRIREDREMPDETNLLAIVPETSLLDPLPSPSHAPAGADSSLSRSSHSEVSLQRVKKEEVEAKISAWQTAKIAKINNRFKREDAIINGWESEQIQKTASWMKKVERKLEEKRAKALEKMQNEVAKARRKAEEKRASAEAKRGTKVASVLELANLMRAVGRPPVKRSIF